MAYCIHGNEFLRTISEGMNKAQGESWARHYKKLYAYIAEADQLDDDALRAEVNAFARSDIKRWTYTDAKNPQWHTEIIGKGKTEREAMIDTVKKIRRITFEE